MQNVRRQYGAFTTSPLYLISMHRLWRYYYFGDSPKNLETLASQLPVSIKIFFARKFRGLSLVKYNVVRTNGAAGGRMCGFNQLY